MFLGMRLGQCIVVVLVAALACYLVRSSCLSLGLQCQSLIRCCMVLWVVRVMAARVVVFACLEAILQTLFLDKSRTWAKDRLV